jgi:hypothetical protein
MNAFVNLKPVLDTNTLDSALPDWPDVLARQQALQTHVWVDEWLAAVPHPTVAHADHSLAATGLAIAAHQQPVDTPVWQTEWLEWADSRVAVPTQSKSAVETATTHTVFPFVHAQSLPMPHGHKNAVRPQPQLVNIAA